MVRVQAAMDGTIGNGRSAFRLIRKDTVFDLAPGSSIPKWVAIVPPDTRANEPLLLKRNPKTGKWEVAGAKPAAPAEPSSFSELANGAAKADAKALKGKTAADALA